MYALAVSPENGERRQKQMNSLRKEIDEYICGIHSDYEPNTCDVNVILKMIEKRIDSIMQREISDSHHFEIQRLKNDLSTTDAIVRICRELKEILK